MESLASAVSVKSPADVVIVEAAPASIVIALPTSISTAVDLTCVFVVVAWPTLIVLAELPVPILIFCATASSPTLIAAPLELIETTPAPSISTTPPAVIFIPPLVDVNLTESAAVPAEFVIAIFSSAAVPFAETLTNVSLLALPIIKSLPSAIFIVIPPAVDVKLIASLPVPAVFVKLIVWEAPAVACNLIASATLPSADIKIPPALASKLIAAADEPCVLVTTIVSSVPWLVVNPIALAALSFDEINTWPPLKAISLPAAASISTDVASTSRLPLRSNAPAIVVFPLTSTLNLSVFTLRLVLTAKAAFIDTSPIAVVVSLAVPKTIVLFLSSVAPKPIAVEFVTPVSEVVVLVPINVLLLPVVIAEPADLPKLTLLLPVVTLSKFW